MNNFVFFSLIVSVTADQSSFQASVSKVIDSLEQTVIPGNNVHAGEALGRKLYVQQILKLAAKSPAFSAGHDAWFKTAKIKLEDILFSLRLARGADQTTVDLIQNAFQHCTDASGTANGHGGFSASHDAIRDAAKIAHNDCRIDEQALIDTVKTHCDTFQSAASTRTDNDVGAYKCASGLALYDLVGDARLSLGPQPGGTQHVVYNQWNDFFTEQQTHYADISIATLSQNCLTHYDNWKAKNGLLDGNPANTCGDLQLKYEEAFCARKIQLTIQCGQDIACHEHYTTEYEDTHTQVLSDADQRIRDAAMIFYAICLLDQLANGSTNATVVALDAACAHHLSNPTTVYQDGPADGGYGINVTNLPSIPTSGFTDCTSQVWHTETDPTGSAAWYNALLVGVIAATHSTSAATIGSFNGPFRVPTPGLCTSAFTYTSRGPAYYMKVTETGSNAEYWHNESVGA